MRRAALVVTVLALSGSLGSPVVAGADGALANARIVGDVLVCNIPGHCLTRVFAVSAINSAGQVTASTSTTGVRNHFRLRVPAGEYSLLATSQGLECRGSAVATAGEKVTANITCLVP